MNSLSSIDNEWEDLQIKVFSRWLQSHLLPLKIAVQDCTKDLLDGVALVELAQILTRRQAPRKWERQPKRDIQKVENCDLAIQMFQNDHVKFINISGKDLTDGNVKLILGFVWTLIMHYSISSVSRRRLSSATTMSARQQTASEELKDWAYSRLGSKYPQIKGFEKNFDYALCALLDSYLPNEINFNQLKPRDHENNMNLAVHVMQERGINVFIFPEDLIESEYMIDNKTLLTQFSAIRSVLEGTAPKTSAPVDLSHKTNSAYAGRKFRLTMTLSGSNYNNGARVSDKYTSGPSKTLGVTLSRPYEPFMNQAGNRLDLAVPSSTDRFQQFTFGQGTWNTVIDSFERQGMVWDVCDQDNLDPPEGTAIYLFPFHGRHNQHFVYLEEDKHIYALQNGQVVTYVGGDIPFVMMKPTDALKERQTFDIHFL